MRFSSSNRPAISLMAHALSKAEANKAAMRLAGMRRNLANRLDSEVVLPKLRRTVLEIWQSRRADSGCRSFGDFSCRSCRPQNYFARVGENPRTRRPGGVARRRSPGARLAESTGRRFAVPIGIMPRKRSTIDEKPGPLPAIRTDGQSVTFDMVVKDADSRLILRCDTNGSVWASIVERQPSGEWWWTP